MPIFFRAPAALTLTSLSVSPNLPINGSMALTLPMTPRDHAALLRTSPSTSPSVPTSGSTAASPSSAT